MRIHRIVFVVALLAASLSLEVVTEARGLAAQEIPLVPHPTEGREDCLLCHDTDKLRPFPQDHAGRASTSCLGCHQAETSQQIPAVPHTIADREGCLVCHAAGMLRPFPADHAGRTNTYCLVCHRAPTADEVPLVFHTMEGRQDCLVCHSTDKANPFPPDHVGRNSTYCPVCHEFRRSETATPTPAPTATLAPALLAVPTPIHEPEMFQDNSCVACHSQLGGRQAHFTDNWSQSIHAARGVGCVSCHGGDPTKTEATEAMSPAAGYLGPLPKEDIPGLCGSCHARTEYMRPYDLATDQLAQYWQSKHGQALLAGDPNVATCFDCHGGHRVLRVSDPASVAYPANEPAMCGRCHADQALMEPYGIPTTQYELYQQSVHGIARLEKQDPRAPTCSTCHGTHGAAPPGFREVANVCGQCHTVTEDYYLQGAHRTGMTSQAGPGCVTCHGHYDVQPATREILLGMEEAQEQSCGTCHAPGKVERHCGSCHTPGSEIADRIKTIYQVMEEANVLYKEAESVVAQAARQRLIVAEQEELLQRARTPLIELRALQHDVDLTQIQAKADESMALSRQAQTSAQEAIKEINTRRLAMAIALTVILVTIVALVLIKRELDRDLEARRRSVRDERGPAG